VTQGEGDSGSPANRRLLRGKRFERTRRRQARDEPPQLRSGSVGAGAERARFATDRARRSISCSEPSSEPDAVRTVLSRYVLSRTVLAALSALDLEHRANRSLELADAPQWLIDQWREEILGWELPSLVQRGRNGIAIAATQPVTDPKGGEISGGRRRSTAVASSGRVPDDRDRRRSGLPP